MLQVVVVRNISRAAMVGLEERQRRPTRIRRNIKPCASPATTSTSSTPVHVRGIAVMRATVGMNAPPNPARPSLAESGNRERREQNAARQNVNATRPLITATLRVKSPHRSNRTSASRDHDASQERRRTRLISRSALAARAAIQASGGASASGSSAFVVDVSTEATLGKVESTPRGTVQGTYAPGLPLSTCPVAS